MKTDTSDDFQFSLAGRVRNLGFAPSPLNALFPLFEAIANAFHAIEARWDREATAKGVITVTILRSSSDDENPPVAGFLIEDNGIGLNTDNWRAFRTADTASKISRGGKGVGRLSWLKVFQNTHVNSSFSEGGSTLHRSFDFAVAQNDASPLIGHELRLAGETPTIGTKVRLEPYVQSYSAHCPRKVDTIAAHIIGHFLRNFASYEVPSFTLVDRAERISLLDFYSSNVESDTPETLKVVLEPGKNRSTLICTTSCSTRDCACTTAASTGTCMWAMAVLFATRKSIISLGLVTSVKIATPSISAWCQATT
ncbi:hypothetical protein GCM10020258_54930 [Sphingomonas yabuuchiae]